MTTATKRRPAVTITYADRLAAHLKALRLERGLTVKDLAKASGICWQNLYAYEGGTRGIPADLYPILAKALGCKQPADFFPTFRR